MKVYLLYDVADMKNMLRQEVYNARQDFVNQLTGDQVFSHDLLATENGQLYRVGVIWDATEDVESMPVTEIPENGQGFFGPCIDLTKLPENSIDKSFLVKREGNEVNS